MEALCSYARHRYRYSLFAWYGQWYAVRLTLNECEKMT